MMADEALHGCDSFRFVLPLPPLRRQICPLVPPVVRLPHCPSSHGLFHLLLTTRSLGQDERPMMADDALSPSRRNGEEAVTKRPRSCAIGAIGAAAQTIAADEGSLTYQRRGKSEAETKR